MPIFRSAPARYTDSHSTHRLDAVQDARSAQTLLSKNFSALPKAAAPE